MSAPKLDVTIQAGRAVRWLNTTNAPVKIVSTGDDPGGDEFESPEIAAGSAYAHRYFYAGLFRFTVGAASGRVTVTE